MRVLCLEEECVIEIETAKRCGKRLSFTTSNGDCYYTNDFYDETVTRRRLSDLAINGYIAINKLNINSNIVKGK